MKQLFLAQMNLTRQKADDIVKNIMIDGNGSYTNMGINPQFLAEKDGIFFTTKIQTDGELIFCLNIEKRQGFNIEALDGLWLIKERQ